MNKLYKIIIEDKTLKETYYIDVKGKNLSDARIEARHWIINHCDLSHEFEITFDLTGEDVGL